MLPIGMRLRKRKIKKIKERLRLVRRYIMKPRCWTMNSNSAFSRLLGYILYKLCCFWIGHYWEGWSVTLAARSNIDRPDDWHKFAPSSLESPDLSVYDLVLPLGPAYIQYLVVLSPDSFSPLILPSGGRLILGKMGALTPSVTPPSQPTDYFDWQHKRSSSSYQSSSDGSGSAEVSRSKLLAWGGTKLDR